LPGWGRLDVVVGIEHDGGGAVGSGDLAVDGGIAAGDLLQCDVGEAGLPEQLEPRSAPRSSPSFLPSRRHRGHRATTWVPAPPSTIASISFRPPMTARLPVASTNRAAASTLGPIDPAANGSSRSSLGVTRSSLRCSGVPQPV